MIEPTLVSLIGMTAAIVTTFCWLPQAWQIIRTRDTRAISLPAYFAFATGILLWLIYGLSLGDIPLILSNTVTLVLQITIVGLKLRYG
jgi:MtN3 and saliva related transmembrane protein